MYIFDALRQESSHAANTPRWQLLLGLMLLAALTVVAGYVASTGNLILGAIALAGVIGLGMATSAPLMLWATLGVGLLVSGIARLYFPELQLVRWAIVPVSFALAIHGFIQYSYRSSGTLPTIVWWAGVFVLLTVATTMVNGKDFMTALTGLKGYFQVWGLLFGLALVKWPDRIIDNLPKVILAAAFIQIPFVLHQYFFIVPTRIGLGGGIVPVDIVSGTFGASAEGGGANSALSAFMIAVVACLTALWQRGVLSGFRLFVCAVLLLFPIALNESKVSVLFLFAAFLVLFGGDFVHRPARFFGALLAGLVALGVLLAFYVAHAPKGIDNWRQLVEYTYKSNVESSTDFSGELSRAGAVRYWFQRHGTKDVFGTMFGHGVGISRVSTGAKIGDDQEDLDPNLKVGRISAIAILWDVGVVGLICVLGLYASAFITAGRLARHFADTPWRAGLFHGLQAAVAVVFLSFINKRFFVFHIGFQTFLMLIFGYLAYWSHCLKGTEQESLRPRSGSVSG